MSTRLTYICILFAVQDGGVLRAYPASATRLSSKYRTACVEPILDRLVIFWADHRTPHEVFPAYKPRLDHLKDTCWLIVLTKHHRNAIRSVSTATDTTVWRDTTQFQHIISHAITYLTRHPEKFMLRKVGSWRIKVCVGILDKMVIDRHY